MVYFEKSQPAPLSLAIEKKKDSGSYREQDVISALNKDFKNKCYICEQKQSTTFNVEHFISHKNDKDLKFNWNNLFLSCGHCNNVKLAKFDSILNCTIIDDKVDTAIYYRCNPFPKEKAFFEVKIKSLKAEKTKELLDKTFNGEHTPLKILESSKLRDLLLKEIKVFQDLLFEYYENEDKDIFLVKIKEHLSNRSAFTAFKRWIIRDNEVLFDDFGQYCNDNTTAKKDLKK